MKSPKKILMVASALAVISLSGCTVPHYKNTYYPPSTASRYIDDHIDRFEEAAGQKSEKASYHIINGKGVLRVGNRVYVR